MAFCNKIVQIAAKYHLSDFILTILTIHVIIIFLFIHGCQRYTGYEFRGAMAGLKTLRDLRASA